jgi:hypothetical protein
MRQKKTITITGTNEELRYESLPQEQKKKKKKGTSVQTCEK